MWTHLLKIIEKIAESRKVAEKLVEALDDNKQITPKAITEASRPHVEVKPQVKRTPSLKNTYTPGDGYYETYYDEDGTPFYER